MVESIVLAGSVCVKVLLEAAMMVVRAVTVWSKVMLMFRDSVVVEMVTMGGGIMVVVIVMFSLTVDKTVSCCTVVIKAVVASAHEEVEALVHVDEIDCVVETTGVELVGVMHGSEVLVRKVESVCVLQAKEELVGPLCSYTFMAQSPPQASRALPEHGVRQFQAPIGVSGVRLSPQKHSEPYSRPKNL